MRSIPDTATLVAALPIPVMVIGEGREISATNAALDRLLGAGLGGRHFITALRQPTLLEAIERSFETGAAETARYLGRDSGRDTTYIVHINPVGAAVVLTFEDQTAAESVGQLRRDFVANVSHELRTPLTALMGFIETLRGAARDDPAARDRFLDIMEREAGRMTRLVDDLLSLSRVEENERVRPNQVVELGALLASAVTEMQPVIQKAGGAVQIDDASAGASLVADDGQLRQVIGNLIENAVKYGAGSDPVRVTLSAPSFQPALRRDGVVLTVWNGGDGIPAHHIPRLTERFYRVDTHRSREIGGTGLGLAIVKHIISRHRGRFQMESTEGQGVTARVILPLTQGPADEG